MRRLLGRELRAAAIHEAAHAAPDQAAARVQACASSHYCARELEALGHTVRLMPPAYVRPYVKRHKNDAADAEAICEAVTRANMRFVPTKTCQK
jgi:transposase